MKANKVFYVIGAIVLIMIGGMLYLLFGKDSSSSTQTKTQNVLDMSLKDLTPEEIRQLGLEGDTKNDTVRTLIGTAKENNRRYERVVTQNEKIIRENEELRKREQNIQSQVDDAVQAQTQDLLNMVAELKGEIELLAQNRTSTSSDNGENLSSGIGINSGKSLPIGQGQPGAIELDDENRIEWQNPDDFIQDERNPAKFSFPASSTKAGAGHTSEKKGLPFIGNVDADTPANGKTRTTKRTTRPIYTIPENSTLMGSTSMTALLGRIPVGNSVNDPYPFKVIIGRDNLIANGIELPDVEQAIVSGTATGDWTLSCVRGDVKSLTFVFTDGRIVTSGKGGGNNEKIGWLSDPHGLPCIPGERKTNAPEYLGTHFLLAAAGAAAQGYSSAQTTTVVDGNTVVGAVTGQQGKYVLGQALGQGIQETANWFKERYGQNFDAVYVPPGHPVAIHIERTISIDYDSSARKVKYAQSSRTSQLD